MKALDAMSDTNASCSTRPLCDTLEPVSTVWPPIDELVVAIRVPRRTYALQRFIKVGSRRAQAIAKVGIALTRSAAGWRVAAASVAPTIRRCPALERLLADGAPLRSPDDLLPAIDQDVTPIDDIRSSAAYRRRVMARVLFDAVRAS